MRTIISWILQHKRIAFEAILSLLVALSLSYGITMRNNNKKLTESLKIANNNIEAYQGLLSNSQQANNVLQLQLKDLEYTNDKQIASLVKSANDKNIKTKQISTAATQTQTISVTSENKRDIPLVKDTIITDSIIYNIYTRLYYTIQKDSIHTKLNVSNKQDLIVYTKREYKNKKSFFKRLFTLDFKKIDKVQYKIINSNDLIKQDSVRIIQIK